MHILLTGGAGYIGTHICLELIKQNHVPIILDNLSNSKIKYINNIEQYFNSKINFYKGNIKNIEDIEVVFKENNVECVIHLAGLKSTKLSLLNPLEYYDNNIIGTINLLKIMEKYDCKNIIFSSSATVYGIPEKLPIKEDDIINPITPYGDTKQIIEKLLLNISNSNNKWKIIILRYFNPIGLDESGILLEDCNDVPENILPSIINAKKNNTIFKIFGNDYETKDGSTIRDYINVVDLANAHIASINYLSTMINNYEIFNIGTGIGISILDIINTFKQLGCIINYEFKEKRNGDAPIVYTDVSKANNVLNWKAQYNIYHTIKNIIKILNL